MALINLDFNLEDVEDGFSTIEAGSYEAKIEKEPTIEMSGSGKPKMVVYWKIMEGEYVGKGVRDDIPLGVGWRVKPYAEAAGMESGAQLDTNAFVGTEAIIEVTLGEYNGSPRNYIKNVIVP